MGSSFLSIFMTGSCKALPPNQKSHRGTNDGRFFQRLKKKEVKFGLKFFVNFHDWNLQVSATQPKISPGYKRWQVLPNNQEERGWNWVQVFRQFSWLDLARLCHPIKNLTGVQMMAGSSKDSRRKRLNLGSSFLSIFVTGICMAVCAYSRRKEEKGFACNVVLRWA